jgi:phage-related protein
MANFPPAGMIEKEDSQYFSVEHRDNTISSTTEDGYEITRPRGTRAPGRDFESGFTEITNADKALLESFWESVRGTANIFTWNDPTTNQTLSVRFQGTFGFKYIGIGGTHRWNLQFKLREV